MPRLSAPIPVLALIVMAALVAGCTFTTPPLGSQTPGPTVTGTTTAVATGTVQPTATTTQAATATGTLPATATATLTTTSTSTPAGPGSISGTKWNDRDANHRRDPGEPVLQGWTIRLERQEANGPDWTEVARTTTDANGAYSFTGLAEGHYRVYESVQSGWTRTYPTSAEGFHNLVISNGQPSWSGQDFGNTGSGGGGGVATGTATATRTGTGTSTATVTGTATATGTATPTVTGTATGTSAVTAVPTPTATGVYTIGGMTYYGDILTARNFAYDRNLFTVPAGATVILTFINDDPGVPHNFALYTTSAATTPLFQGGVVTGQQTTVYTFTAPSTPGTYFFRCDVHPTTMTGSFVVT